MPSEVSGSAAVADVGAPSEAQKCEPSRYDVEGYSMRTCSPCVTTKSILQMFSENRPALFMRLVQQVLEKGYELEVGAVGVQEWPIRERQYHSLGTRAMEGLPSQLAFALSESGKPTRLYRKWRMFSRPLDYQDPLHEVRLEGNTALSMPVSHNMRKKLSITPLVIGFSQDASDLGKVVVEISDWMRQGEVNWSKTYDTRNFQEQDVGYDALDMEKLLLKIKGDVMPVINAYQMPTRAEKPGVMQGGLSEIGFYAPQLVSVIEGGAGHCMAPHLFPVETMQVHSVEDGLADSFRTLASAAQLRGTVVTLDVPRSPHSVLVDGQIGSLTWSKGEAGKESKQEEYTDKYYNLVTVSRSKAGEVVGISVALAPNFAENVFKEGDPVFSDVNLELPDPADGYNPCVQQRLIYPTVVSKKTGHRLFPLTDNTSVTTMTGHFDEAVEIIKEMEDAFGIPPTSAVAGIIASDDENMNGFIHPQFPQYMFLTDDLVREFWSKGDVGRKQFYDVVRHEGIHVFDFKYRISEHAAIANFYKQVAVNGDHQFFTVLNESNFIENGFGGHSVSNPKEFLASLINSVMCLDWQQRVVMLPERLRHVYYYGLKAAAASIQETVPSGGDSPLYKRLKECEEFVGKSLSKTDLPVEKVAFSLSEYFRQGKGAITIVTDANVGEVLSKGPVYLWRYGGRYAVSTDIQVSQAAKLRWVAENSGAKIAWIDESVYPELAKELFKHGDFVEVVDGKAARRFNFASSDLGKTLEFIFGGNIPEKLRGEPPDIYFDPYK